MFVRDGFLDCYSGARLVFPGTLRALSILRPSEFPFHPNWKFGECHPAYWDLSPTIDHVIPIAAGGADDEANVVTTSMKVNGAKSTRPFAELGWRRERGTVHPDWDGLLSWFLWAWQAHDELRAHASLRDWHRAAAEYAVDA